jgi:hypothetical protein
MARPKRFELLTPRFVVWCSIQLSYGRALSAKGAEPMHRLPRTQARDLACFIRNRNAANPIATHFI